MTPPSRLARKRDDARAWAAGRRWWPRALLLAYLGYAGVRHLTDAEYASIFSGITLAIHELGHVLFGFLGEWLGVAGGSITQLAAPAAAALVLLRQRDYFGVAVGGAWLSISLSNLAVYVADARAEELPLVSLGGGDVVHDWNYLLGSLHLLPYDTGIAALVRFAALAVLALSVLLGAWLCAIMGRPPREAS
ncbi:MAG TPA: hypothetical protein VEH62_15335 [Gemmatimonadales bacterium]|nr:hypothetical protein [Gemmatimonadales bacterium]